MLAAAEAYSVFTPTHHAWSLVVFVVVVVGLVLAGRRWDVPTRRTIAAVGFGVWLLSGVYYVLPANLEPDKSLPIQACDLLALIAPLTLMLPSRLLRSVTYFGAFGLTAQAFATPVSGIGGPDSIKFWIFWLLHGVIVGTAIYLVAVDRFRPSFSDLRRAVIFWGVYAIAMIALNFGTYVGDLNHGDGWYYGYLGPSIPQEASGTILSKLGPWPLRPLMMMLVALTIFVLLWLPWAAAQWIGGVNREDDPPKQ